MRVLRSSCLSADVKTLNCGNARSSSGSESAVDSTVHTSHDRFKVFFVDHGIVLLLILRVYGHLF